MRALIVGMALLLTISTAAMASNWLPVGSTSEGEAFVDSASVTRDGPVLKAWVMWNYAEARVSEGDPSKKYLSVRQRLNVNCEDRQIRIMSRTEFPEKDLNGAAIMAIDTSMSSWIEVAPDTSGEAILEVVCVLPPKS